ncbi:MAG: hypothetical protein ACYCYK_03050 [Candidatus Dormibacteria bacterium]
MRAGEQIDPLTDDAPAWSSCWPTADETTISFCCPLEEGPWLAGRALEVLRSTGRVRPDPERDRYAVGAGRAAPLILGEPLYWHDLAMVLEVCQAVGEMTGEVTLRLPPWVELAAAVDEESVWGICDSLAGELGARCAVVSDGRAIGYPDLTAPKRAAPRLQLVHLGVVIPPDWLGFLRPGSTSYRHLPQSDLVVVLE